jgi:hypothetical protein
LWSEIFHVYRDNFLSEKYTNFVIIFDFYQPNFRRNIWHIRKALTKTKYYPMEQLMGEKELSRDKGKARENCIK